MAEQIGLEIEINGATKSLKSVKDLTDAVKELEKKASESDFGSDEYKKATQSAEELKKKMGELSGDASKKLGQSLTDLKKQYKELKVALSDASNPQEFSRLSKELNDVEGKIGDMNDAASLATGSGVEQLNKGISLIGEGFRNFDFEKIKIGFKGIGNAMSAAAPLLLVAAIGYLIENFKEVVDFAKQLTGTFSEEEKAVKNLNRELENQKEVNKTLIPQLQNQIRLLEAQGVSEAEIIAKKKELFDAQIKELQATVELNKAKVREINSNDDLFESEQKLIVQVLRKAGENEKADLLEKNIQRQKVNRAKEYLTAINDSENAIDKLKTDLAIEDINRDKKAVESAKKTAEEKKKIAEQNAKEIDAINQAAWEEQQKRNKSDVDKRMAEADQAIADFEAEQKRLAELEDFEQQRKLEKDKAHREEKKKLDEADAKAKQALEKASFDAAKNLSDAIFQIQIGNAKKGSAEETKLKKQQFEVNKAFAITQATIDGIRAVQTVLASYPTPFNIPIAIATGVSAAANIAKIASTKFEGGGGGGSASAPTAGSGNQTLPTPPTINQNNTKTNFDEQGNNLGKSSQRQMIDITGKVTVSENDISEIQKRANKLKAQTTI